MPVALLPPSVLPLEPRPRLKPPASWLLFETLPVSVLSLAALSEKPSLPVTVLFSNVLAETLPSQKPHAPLSSARFPRKVLFEANPTR